MSPRLVHRYTILRDGLTTLEVEAQFVRQAPDGIEIWTDGEIWILNGPGWTIEEIGG